MTGHSLYYRDEFVTLYHGDCREILPTLPTVDLCITDPPYRSLDIDVIRGTTTRLVGGGMAAGRKSSNANRLGAESNWFATMSDPELSVVLAVCRDRLSVAGALYVFADVKTGLALFPSLAPKNVLVWDKGKIGMGYSWRRMHEWIAYCPQPDHALRDMGLGDIVRCASVDAKVHPTEKPTGTITPLLLNSSDEGALVLDPFAGAGATLVAAKNLSRRAIGIEIDERHCATIAARLSQNVLDFGGVA